MMAKRFLLRHATCPSSCPLLHRSSQPMQDGRGIKNLRRNLASVSSSSLNNVDETIKATANEVKASSSTATNANPNEVHKFSSFASHWWDSRSNPLVGMNPIRIKFLRDVVDSFQPPPVTSDTTTTTPILQQLPLHNKRVLDIGCGGGLLTESLSRLGASLVVGVDASTHVVEVAKCHSFHENSRLILPKKDGDSGLASSSSESSSRRDIRYIGGMTVEELALNWLQKHEQEQTSSTSTTQQHELFDIITALEIIEHVPNPSSLLNAAKSLLKPNGILFVSTINRTAKSYGLAIIAAEYISGKVPIGTHTWDMFRSPVEVEQMIVCEKNSNDNNGRMRQIALSGMALQPPFINMEWKLDGNDTDVNWIGAYQKQ